MIESPCMLVVVPGPSLYAFHISFALDNNLPLKVKELKLTCMVESNNKKHHKD